MPSHPLENVSNIRWYTMGHNGSFTTSFEIFQSVYLHAQLNQILYRRFYGNVNPAFILAHLIMATCGAKYTTALNDR